MYKNSAILNVQILDVCCHPCFLLFNHGFEIKVYLFAKDNLILAKKHNQTIFKRTFYYYRITIVLLTFPPVQNAEYWVRNVIFKTRQLQIFSGVVFLIKWKHRSRQLFGSYNDLWYWWFENMKQIRKLIFFNDSKVEG